MGRWPSWDRKTTVEECFTLSVFDLNRFGVFKLGPNLFKVSWTSGDEETGNIGFWLLVKDDRPSALRLCYRVTNSSTGTSQDLDYRVTLVSTPCNFGGERYWFLCPACGRRVATLHLPPNQSYFGCRHCYDLTYTSCQKSHEFDGLYGRIALDLGTTPEMVKRAFEH